MSIDKIFGTDGIRDIVNKGYLTPQFLLKLGRVIGSNIIPTLANCHRKKRVIIGRDTRLSGKAIEEIISAGLISTDVDVVKAGIISTPGLAYLTKQGRYIFGIMISASHNPVNYNGIKLFSSSGLKIITSMEKKIEKYLRLPTGVLTQAGTKLLPKTPSTSRGSILTVSQKDLMEEYVNHMIRTVFGDLCSRNYARGMRIVVDCANGSLYEIAATIFKKIGATVIAINNNSNGKHINHQCGSLHPQSLRCKVLATKSHIGFSFDGDGDRVILVDENGIVRDGDFILYIAALYLKKHCLLKNNTVVGTTMTNSALENLLGEQGIKLIRTPVGDKYVLEEMIQGNFSLGGEPSGHIIFSDYSKNGDGIITALMILKIMKEQRSSLFTLSENLIKYPQLIINVPVKSKPPLEKIEPIRNKVKEIKNILESQGRLVLRYSGTEPLVRIMIEGRNQKQVKSLAQNLAKTIKEFI